MKTKESERLATPEDDMYYIEAIKSSRILKDVGGFVLQLLTRNSFRSRINHSVPKGQARVPYQVARL